MSILKPIRIAFMLCATAALALAAGPAFAHAKLLSEVPAEAAASTAPVTELRLTFSEALNSAFSKAQVVDAAGAEANATVALDAADAKVLVVTFPAALAAGTYTVNWTAVSDDGHKTTGSYQLVVAQ
jgi:hypothetical protein